eukprot:2277970-Amphidinium_carterae.1
MLKEQPTPRRACSGESALALPVPCLPLVPALYAVCTSACMLVLRSPRRGKFEQSTDEPKISRQTCLLREHVIKDLCSDLFAEVIS